jgi:hypothetical protein
MGLKTEILAVVSYRAISVVKIFHRSIHHIFVHKLSHNTCTTSSQDNWFLYIREV